MGRVRRGGKPNRTARPRGINISSQPVCARLTASRITITDLGDHDGAIWSITIAEIRKRMSADQKITALHLKRNAYLYVRQSTVRQVFENTERDRKSVV